jgi:hypothetical protein
MRRELVMVGIFVLFSFSFASAADCSDDQTIMRLYSDSNSHVSFWNESTGTYLNEICYDDIFGVEYPGNYPHACSGENRVLSLYDVANSHASQTSDANYNDEVCYGDLSCVYESGVTCSNGGEVVAKLSAPTNAHVSDPSSSSYTIKVCCVSGESSASQVYWADAGGNKITEADLGDTVYLVSKWTTSGTFKIMEDDGLPFGIGDNYIRDVVGVANGPNLIGVWTIKTEDLDKTSDYEEFYFEIDGKVSDYLSIDIIGEDDPMEISIVSPLCGTYYDEGDSITIKVLADDSDDIVDGNVSVNGENINFSNGGVTVSRTLSVPGSLRVVAEASNTRGERSRVISNIMVLDKSGGSYVDGDYIAACIDKPKNFEHITGSVVEFDASSTRGVKVVGGVVSVLVPGTNPFDWYWIFNRGKELQFEISRSEISDGLNPLAYNFFIDFPVAGDNSASLRVEI